MDVLWDWDQEGHALRHATSGTLPQGRVSLFGVKAWGGYTNYANELAYGGREPMGYMQWLVDSGVVLHQECIAKVNDTERLLFTDVLAKCGGAIAELAVKQAEEALARKEKQAVADQIVQAEVTQTAVTLARKEEQAVADQMRETLAAEAATALARKETQAVADQMRAEKEMVALARKETQAVADQVRATAAALAEREAVAMATEATHAAVGESVIIKQAQLSARDSELSARDSELSDRELQLSDRESRLSDRESQLLVRETAHRTKFRIDTSGKFSDGVYGGKRLSKTIWRLEGPEDYRLALFASPRSNERVSRWNTPLFLSMPCKKDDHPSEIDPKSGKMTCARYENVDGHKVVVFTHASGQKY
jgi:hypothetical protein